MACNALDELRDDETLKQIVEQLLARYDDNFRLTAIIRWVVTELEQTMLGPSPTATAAFVAGAAAVPLDISAVMAAMKRAPASVPQPIKELFESFRLHPNRWGEFQDDGLRKRLEIEEILRQPEWAHLAYSPRRTG